MKNRRDTVFQSKTFQFTYQKLLFLSLIILLPFFAFFLIFGNRVITTSQTKSTFWDFQSIDTMKYSRDLAREKLSDPTFDNVIDKQIKDIAATGATHVAIATPYDEEFYPILQRWVSKARKYHLNVWFRGNFSGWEGWFEYQRIDRIKHLELTAEFIKRHSAIFQDGDVFTACPECENGGPGDPRKTGDIEGHRKFLIDEYKVTKNEFEKLGKKVRSNFDSMNKDVATIVMDKQTTAHLDYVVTIDHYVNTPEKLASDVKQLAEETGGKIVLGEFGAPIPDLNGIMTQKEQADWITSTGKLLVNLPQLIGLSYWVNTGGSTQLWDDKGTKLLGVDALSSIYNPKQLILKIIDASGDSVVNAKIRGLERFTYSQNDGFFALPYIDSEQTVLITSNNYKPVSYKISYLLEKSSIILDKSHEDSLFKLRKILKRAFPFI